MHSSRHPPTSTPSRDERNLDHGNSPPAKPRADGAACCELRAGEGGVDETCPALDATAVDPEGVEGCGVQRAMGAEGVGAISRDGKHDENEGIARTSDSSDFRQDKVAVMAAESSGWCSVAPENGVLLPGEKLELRFTALVSGAKECGAIGVLLLRSPKSLRMRGGEYVRAFRLQKVPRRLPVPAAKSLGSCIMLGCC